MQPTLAAPRQGPSASNNTFIFGSIPTIDYLYHLTKYYGSLAPVFISIIGNNQYGRLSRIRDDEGKTGCTGRPCEHDSACNTRRVHY